MELSQCHLFNQLDRDDIVLLESISNKKKYPKDSLLFYAGELPKTLRLIESGIVSIYKNDAAGNEIIMTDFKANDLVAEMAHFENIPYPASARCKTEVVLYEIDFDEFKNKFLERPEIAIKIIRSLTQKIKQLEGVIQRTLIDDAQTRLARFLVDNVSILNVITQKEIATKIATTPETVSRILRRFKENNWIKVDSKKIIIMNIHALKQVSE